MTVTPHEELLADLNPAQREAVLHVDGPLLVVAGAGSGKTRVLTHRVAHLIRAHGVKPNEILAITFTNKAAAEMRERLERTLGRTARAIWILTFHAACGRILRREAERLGYRSTFTIYDQADQVRVVKACLEELGRIRSASRRGGSTRQISNAKNQLISPEDYCVARRIVLGPDGRRGVRALPAAAVRLERGRLRRHADADRPGARALPRGARALAARRSATSSSTSTRTRTTPSTACCSCSPAKHRNVFAVGDPDQSIYAFRGADIRNILDFERDFGGAASIALEQNYRSTNAILEAANAVIDNNRDRKPKRLWSELGEGEPVEVVEVEDEHAEARFVAAEIAATGRGRATRPPRSRSSTARTPSRACWRTCSCGRASRTR